MNITKKLLCIFSIIILIFGTNIVSSASEYPTINDYRFEVVYDDSYSTNFYSWNWSNHLVLSDRQIGVSYAQPFYAYSGARFEFDFDLTKYISKYAVLFKNSTNAWIQVNIDTEVDFGLESTAAGSVATNYFYINGASNQLQGSTTSFNGYVNGSGAFSPFEVGQYFKNYGDILSFRTLASFYLNFGDDAYYSLNIKYLLRSYSVVIYLQGVDGQDAEQFIVITNNLKNIESSINNVRDEVKVMQGQLDNIQSDINSGFNEVGGKLDSMLTPDSNNQQAVDQMGGQVNNNKQEAEDIKDQIDSLDKPDPDDLIDQIDPDQFIDNDNEAVQEMTGILASITSNKVVKNYLLLLLGIGIVSFVVYGKKGG